MNDLYERLTELCEKKGVSRYKMCRDTKLQPSLLTDLKMGRQNGISAKKASTLAEYFGVSEEYILYGKKEKPATSGDGLSEFEAAVLSADERQRQLIMRVLSLPAEQQDAFLTMTQAFQNGQ